MIIAASARYSLAMARFARGKTVWGLLAALLTISCGGAPASSTQTATDATPEFVVLTIDTVRVAAARPEGAGPWDGPIEAAKKGCGFTAAVAGLLVSPAAAGLARSLCETSGGRQEERDPKAPDLVLTLDMGNHVFHTPIARDSYYQNFGYKVVIPLHEVPTHGVKLSVIDQDGENVTDGELMGLFRLDQRDLRPGALQRAKAGSVEEIVFSTAPYVVIPEPTELIVQTKEGLHVTDLEIIAGEDVEIQANGRYIASSYDGVEIGPKGYPREKRSYNLTMSPLREGPHGAAIAIFAADDTAVEAVLVGACARVIAPHSGTLTVGVNDRDPSNNSGELAFRISRRAPAHSATAANTSCE